MNRDIFFKRIVFIIINIYLVIISSLVSNAAVQVPEKIRIGLYYESTAVSVFTISAEKGIQIGSCRDSAFVPLYSEPSNKDVTVRKDSYFVNVSGKITPYNINDKSIPAGDRIGPYHVQIGAVYNDVYSANAAIQDLKIKGIDAYPVFTDTWQVWTGFYTDQNAAQADITNNIKLKFADGVFNIIQPASNRIIVIKPGGDVAFAFGSEAGRLQIKPAKDNTPYIFRLNSDKNLLFRGDLEVRRFTASDMTLVNILPTDHYLYGVIPSEIGSGSDPEALKAQAVAARTYSLSSMGKHGKWDFDLCTTTSCQVYKGYDNEASTTNKAVDDTKGKKITYNGKPAEVFYYSSSGGKTEDVKNVWGSDIPYLVSVEDKYESTTSYHYTWSTSLTSEKIYSTLKNRGFDLGDILSISITKTAPSGRVTELVIKGTKNQRVYKLDGCRTVFGFDSQWYSITTDSDIYVSYSGSTAVKTQLGGKKVMTASGLKELPSVKGSTITVLGAGGQKKVIQTIPATYTFNGKGWGHAVGMSQEGAKGMAKAGFKYDEILLHYFPGTKVE